MRMEENRKKKSTKGVGRKPKSDPAVHRYVVRLNSEENGRFNIQFQKSGLKEHSKFIKAMLFGHEIKVVKIDKATMDYYIRLTNFYHQFQGIGNNYNQTVKAVKTNFDWNANEATWSGDVKPGRAGPVALKTGDMDALLVNLALVRDVAAGKPLNYRMVENGNARPMNYRVVGKEKISVGGKSREATKVSRTSGDKEIVVWVVPGMPVPARILQREDGQDSIDLQVKSWH